MIFEHVQCLDCGQAYPRVGLPYCCPLCGGLYDYVHPWVLEAPLPKVSLGEGGTPLIWTEVQGRRVAFKCEFMNPTGSFKDRGSAMLVSALVARGVSAAVEDSSGNAGASFAAYAARAGIKARVYAPSSASGAKRVQIEAYGAELVTVAGPRSEAAQAVRLAAQQGAVYASHAYLPFNLPGYASLAVELWQDLGEPPGAVILPAGQGGLLLGLGRCFQVMQSAGMIVNLPILIGVQAAACAPLYRLWVYGRLEADESPTLAEGVRVQQPVRADAVVHLVRAAGGRFLTVDEAAILPGRDELARRGLYVEPTSALVWSALEMALADLPDPVVVVLTGSGLKSAI